MAGKNILIVGPSWVGDMVMAQSLFITLAQKNASIDVLAPAWSEALLSRMPEVTNRIAMPLGHGELGIGKRRQLGAVLKERNYDQAIVLPNSLKSALVPFFADIPLRTGWLGEMRYFLLNDPRKLIKKRYPLMVQRFNALAYEPGAELPVSPPPSLLIDEAAASELYSLFDLPKDFIALCPGAEFGPAKRWPEDKFAEVANYYLDAGRQIVIFGSEKDQPVAQAIIDALPAARQSGVTSLCGRTSLEQAVDGLSIAAGVVSNDSGLMHIAAALNRPLAVVYGSTSPDFTPPLAPDVSIERTGIECSPCFQRECPLKGDKHLRCLKDLPAKRVIDSLDALLSKTAHAPVTG